MVRVGWLLLLLQPFFLLSTELAPWFGRYLELYPQLTYRYQNYNKIQSPLGDLPYRSKDHIVTGSISSSLGDYALELEGRAAATHAHSFYFDSFRLTGRYVLMNDVLGAPLSAVLGVMLSQVFTKGLEDPSLFHHGEVEGEIFLSLGKECAPKAFWVSRKWALIGVGSGDHGSPWLHGLLVYEKSSCQLRRFKLYLEALGGFGKENLVTTTNFQGYGPIAHRSLDLGLSAEKSFISSLTTFKLEGIYRLWAYNYPKNTFNVIFSIIYPFGL